MRVQLTRCKGWTQATCKNHLQDVTCVNRQCVHQMYKWINCAHPENYVECEEHELDARIAGKSSFAHAFPISEAVPVAVAKTVAPATTKAHCCPNVTFTVSQQAVDDRTVRFLQLKRSSTAHTKPAAQHKWLNPHSKRYRPENTPA